MKLYFIRILIGLCLPLSLTGTPRDAMPELDALEQPLIKEVPEALLQELTTMLNELTALLEETAAENSLNEQTLTLMATIITTILETQAHVQAHQPTAPTVGIVAEGTYKNNPLTPMPESTKQLVINTISTIAGNVAAIAAAPRNPQIVSANLANIVMGIINLMRQVLAKSKTPAIKKHGAETADIVQAAPLTSQHELPISDIH